MSARTSSGSRGAPSTPSRTAIRGLPPALLAAAAVALASAAEPRPQSQDEPLRAWARAHLAELVDVYREFHAHPELSQQEVRTAARLAELWRAAGCEVTERVGGHGVVAVIRNGPGPTVMLRTDLDGLPVTERTDLPYASRETAAAAGGGQSGVMHACGHDVHMTALVGVARFLAAHKDRWRGTALLVGQPAEETLIGAQAMLDDGLFTRFPRPDVAVAQHCDAALAAGKIGIRAGFTLANSDTVDITVHGRGGHGAYPHMTLDPIVQAAELVVALQTLVSREVAPTEAAVVTVGSIHGGTKHNIIGDSCHLQLTVRSYSPAVRAHLLEGIERKAKAVAASARAPEPTVIVGTGTPALENDAELTARVEAAIRRVLGGGSVEPAEQSMGAEDFSRYGVAGVPILMYRLGTVAAPRLEAARQRGEPLPALHSAEFHPDAEPTLETGVVALGTAAVELLR
jgi:hippurate hydrolase